MNSIVQLLSMSEAAALEFEPLRTDIAKRPTLIVTDSAPLITLALANALDAILSGKWLVLVPGMVRFDVIRDTTKPVAQEVADWIRRTQGDCLRVASTEVFEEYLMLASTRPNISTAGRGERAAAEVLSQDLARERHEVSLLFEDGDCGKQNFLASLPDEVLVTSTSQFLSGPYSRPFL